MTEHSIADSRPCVLVVDDDSSFLMWADYILGQNGYAVVCAETVSAAQQAIAECRPDLVLIDVHLGPENGLELLTDLHTDAGKIPSLVVTGYAELDVALTALRGGAFDLVVKPVRTGEFLQSISEALSQGAQSKSQQMLDRVLEQSHHGLLIVDNEGTVLSKAGALDDLLGPGVEGQSLDTVLESRRADREPSKKLVRAIRHGLDTSVVTTLIDASGSVQAIRMATRPLINGSENDPVAWIRIDLISAAEASVLLPEDDAVAQHRLASGISGLPAKGVGDALERGRVGLYGRPFESVIDGETIRLISVEPRIGNALGFDSGVDRTTLDPETNQLLDSWTLTSLTQMQVSSESTDVSYVVSLHDLPAVETADFELLESVLDTLSRKSIQVVLDIDHYHIIEQEQVVRDLLEMTRFHGHRACVRNFGLSAMSVANLKDWPVDFLAIAPAFTRQLRSDTIDCALVRTMAEIASVFEKKTLALDVTLTEQHDALLMTGVNFICGELIGAAVPLLPVPGSLDLAGNLKTPDTRIRR